MLLFCRRLPQGIFISQSIAMSKKSSFPLELASSARIISDNLPGGNMHCCITKKPAAHAGYQPQLPSGRQPAFSFPLLDRSLMKSPSMRGFFLPVVYGEPDNSAVYRT
ncbi:hypothetical protein [Brenneria corticis]|uniref:hypothetical protein n=1 Tax=Brenneria corticis TaxID=2173106 RepID=UPI00109E32E7|nr:hypothetical protein [Brenneria sp. CFCC 11842]